MIKAQSLKETCKGNSIHISLRIHISLTVSIELSANKSIDKGEMNILILVSESGFTGTVLSAHEVM